jgi:hypothetical protein
MIHRQALTLKDLSPALKNILQAIINVVKYIKARPEKSRLFARFCEELGTEHTALLFYCKSKWLSWRNVLTHLFEIRNELFQHLSEKRHNSAHMFSDCDFNMQLAYLRDIFNKMNTINTSLQGGNNNILELYYKL